MLSGVLAGYPVVDVKVTLYDGSYHEVDSSEMAFKIAGSIAFKEAMKKADPVLLEPIMKVVVVVPDEYMGDVIGDLNSRTVERCVHGCCYRCPADQLGSSAELDVRLCYRHAFSYAGPRTVRDGTGSLCRSPEVRIRRNHFQALEKVGIIPYFFWIALDFLSVS